MANELDKIEPWRFEKNHMEYLEDLKPSYFKLYNLENDLGQEINLADDYPEIVERMKHIMLKLQSEMIMEGGNWFEDKDRKSTRLNSSHVAISYAVFCLKKK